MRISGEKHGHPYRERQPIQIDAAEPEEANEEESPITSIRFGCRPAISETRVSGFFIPAHLTPSEALESFAATNRRRRT